MGSDSVRRLRERVPGFFEAICDEEKGYKALRRRSDDWDVEVRGFVPIGNVGMALWEGSRGLAVKWALGWLVQESRDLLKIEDLLGQGKKACRYLGEALVAKPGITVEFRAGPRFNFINSVDPTSEEPGPLLVVPHDAEGKATFVEKLSDLWESELKRFEKVAARSGEEVSGEEALEVKRSFLKCRNPCRDVHKDEMKANQSKWRLYPVFNTFFWLEPKAFMLGAGGKRLSKEDQLENFRNLVGIMAKFACHVSR